jgi:hypothetical protein
MLLQAWWLRTPFQGSTPTAMCCSQDQALGSDFTSQYDMLPPRFDVHFQVADGHWPRGIADSTILPEGIY